MVLCLQDLTLYWFDLSSDEELMIDDDGIIRSILFPGLWMHASALLTKDYKELMHTLYQGLTTPEHARFIERMAQASEANP